MKSFAEKREKPTTDEYLKVGLNEVLDRLNKNPNSLQSEEAFVSAVITVRNAIITEKLNKRLVCLTAIVAIATVLLIGVPFLVPSFEAQKLDAKIDTFQSVQSKLQAENITLKRQLQDQKQDLSILQEQIQKLILKSTMTSQKY